jgi:hypothetical protein
MKIDHCRSCGAPVIWTITDKGKRMPVDAEPNPDGLIELDELPTGVVRSSYAQLTQPRLIAPERYTSHFANCPQAEGWRCG